ncbi:hypothetical protein AGLY_009856 [Aphis glycines]|uniref:Uncharacterized protein n=1 Tax=Aphis glycines TaxID=307491 RepID=A0A6G0TIB5_APHGL|nr:hypothetical protein AGLY_009856 [Aphis glycines]
MIITSRNNASISNFGGGFRWKSEYPWCIKEVKSKHFPTVFKKIEKNKKKMTEKREFLRKISFRPNRFFYMVVIQKLITLNFQKILTFFGVSVKKIWLTKKTRKLNTRFRMAFIIQIFTKSVENAKICNVDKIFLALSKYLKILYKVPHILAYNNYKRTFKNTNLQTICILSI